MSSVRHDFFEDVAAQHIRNAHEMKAHKSPTPTMKKVITKAGKK